MVEAQIEPSTTVNNETEETTEEFYNYYNQDEAADFKTPFVILLGDVLTACACLGALINTTCFLLITTMRIKRKIKSRAEAFLIQQQAFADFCVCVLTVPIRFYEPNDMSTQSPLKEFQCYFWYSQFFYWWAMLLSAFNLMLISVDWLLEVCFVDKHLELRKILGWMLFTIHVCALGGAVPCIFSQKIVDSGACMQPTFYDTIARNGMFISWMGTWVFFAYIIPIVVEMFCYGYMMHFYKKLIRAHPAGAERKAYQKCFTHLIKCQLSVVVFTLFVGFDSIDWLFDAIDEADYVFNTPRQKFSVLLLVVSSVSNPLIHVIFSPEVQDFVRNLRRSVEEPDPTPVVLSSVSSKVGNGKIDNEVFGYS